MNDPRSAIEGTIANPIRICLTRRSPAAASGDLSSLACVVKISDPLVSISAANLSRGANIYQIAPAR